MFSQRRPQQEKSRDDLEAELYQQIGQLKVELDWLKIVAEAPVEPSIFQFVSLTGIIL